MLIAIVCENLCIVRKLVATFPIPLIRVERERALADHIAQGEY